MNNYGLGAEAMTVLRDLVDSIAIVPGERLKYYNFEKFAGHHDSCKRPRGDQACQCGFSTVRWNLEALLDECEGYGGRAAIDKARALLKREGDSEVINKEAR